MTNRFLCIHLPAWPIQRRVVAQPKLRRRAVVLHAHDGNRGRRVIVASPAAVREGIRSGMPVAEALSLARQKRGASADSKRRANRPAVRGKAVEEAAVVLQQHDPEADREALLELAVWCERFSPVVGLEEAAQPQCLLLDVTGLASLFGSEEKLAADAARKLADRGYYTHLAVADTIGAAWAAANYLGCGIGDVGLGAGAGGKSQIRNSKLAVLPAGSALAAIAPLPPVALRLPKQTVELLAELGIETVGRLAALPRDALTARFGGLLVQRLNQAEGKSPEIIVGCRGLPELSVCQPLEHPTEHREAIGEIFRKLIERLCRQLRERDRGAVQLDCRLSLVDHPPACFTVGCFRPTAQPAHLLELIHLQLESLRLSGPVREIAVCAAAAAPLEVRQRQLFADDEREAPQQLALLIDRLSSRLGREAVVGPRPSASALPERAVRYAPLTAAGQAGKKSSSRPRPAKRGSRKLKDKPEGGRPQEHPLRPLKLHQPPAALEVTSVAPDGPPVRFHFGKRQHIVGCCWGPERIETGWWRGRTVRRDYWRVETDAGGRFWLFRNQEDGQWFLHGEFV